MAPFGPSTEARLRVAPFWSFNWKSKTFSPTAGPVGMAAPKALAANKSPAESGSVRVIPHYASWQSFYSRVLIAARQITQVFRPIFKTSLRVQKYEVNLAHRPVALLGEDQFRDAL